MGALAQHCLCQGEGQGGVSNRRDKGRISGPFVPVLKHTTGSAAWRATSHGARSLYIALKSRYNSKLGNAVYLSTRDAADELGPHSHRESVRRWFRELKYNGFIVMIMPGHLGVDGKGKAPHWRLTETSYLGEVANARILRLMGWTWPSTSRKAPELQLKKIGSIGAKAQNESRNQPIQSRVKTTHPVHPWTTHPVQ